MNLSRKFIALILSVVMVSGTFLTLTDNTVVYADCAPRYNALKAEAAGVNDYVYDMYRTFLEREPSSADVTYWGNLLSEKKITAAAVGYLIATSPEFMNGAGGYSDDFFITHLYPGFLGRYCSTDELNYWHNQMAAGMTRDQLFEFFLSSDEFNSLCNDYGIIAGTRTAGRDVTQESNTNLFVERLYSTILGRSSDKSGIKYWTDNLMNGNITGASAGYSFIFSDEYRAQNKNDAAFINDLYSGFFGRTADTAGVNYWISVLNDSSAAYYCTDLDIYLGFCRSPEFAGICQSYGIARGDISAYSEIYNARANRSYFTLEDDIVDIKINNFSIASRSFADALRSITWNSSSGNNRLNANEAVNIDFAMKQKERNEATMYATIYEYHVSSTTGRETYILRYRMPVTYSESTGTYNICTLSGFEQGSYVVMFSTENIHNMTFNEAAENSIGAAVFYVN